MLDGITQALVGIGFSQAGAESQLREINNLILKKAATQMLGEAPSPMSSENDIKAMIEMYYSIEQFRQVFSRIAGEVMEEYYRAVSARLPQEQKNNFYRQIMETVPPTPGPTSVPQPAF